MNGRQGVLHIATHGFFLPKSVLSDPLKKSGLLLSHIKDKLPHTEDGILTGRELSQVDLTQTNLAIFSACETGLGEIMEGDGVMGLERSLKLAGVDNAILSLWKVDDAATQKLFEKFYNNFIQSKNPRTALKQTQLDMIKEKYKPYYWAAFQLHE